MNICEHCGEAQYSVSDKKYLELFGQCWSCDKKLWESGELSLEEFESRERKSVE